MSQKTNEVDNNAQDNDQTASQINAEGSGVHVVMKKGPWTADEDAILADYVSKHGEGRWNIVQKKSGLSRSGKSCRLRWANHLRPDLKKGPFTAKEQRTIAELHAKMGNKWSKMAALLPGRTDNEIKNYWNTRLKKSRRTGMPLYPPEIFLPEFHESNHGQSTGGISDGDRGHHNFSEKNNYDIHHATSDSLKEDKGILPYMPELLDISAYSIPPIGLGSPPYCKFVPSALPNHDHLQESRMSFPCVSELNRNGPYPFAHIKDLTDNIAESFGLHSPIDRGASSRGSICYSHSSNGNSSTSKPTSQAVKLELPSLQFAETELGSQVTSPLPPLNESLDVFIHSPQPIIALDSDCSAPYNSGLLDGLLYEAKTSNCSKNWSDKSSNSSAATPADRSGSSALNMYDTEWEDYPDPVSSFGATSILNEHPAVRTNGHSWDEWAPFQHFSEVEILSENLAGNNVKLPSVDQIWDPKSGNQYTSLSNLTWPDVLPAPDWQELYCEPDENQATKADARDDTSRQQASG